MLPAVNTSNRHPVLGGTNVYRLVGRSGGSMNCLAKKVNGWMSGRLDWDWWTEGVIWTNGSADGRMGTQTNGRRDARARIFILKPEVDKNRQSKDFLSCVTQTEMFGAGAFFF